jgi:hypothetical protein
MRAQVSRSEGSKETVQAIGVGDPEVDLPRLMSQDGQIEQPAKPVKPEKPGDPLAVFYRVMRGGTFSQGDYRATLPEGKIIADNQYEIANLKRQGIRLKEIGAHKCVEDAEDADNATAS